MSIRSLIGPFMLLAALMQTGCSALGQPSVGRVPVDASLVEPCPQLPLLSDTTGAAALRWMIGAAESYNDCAAKHKRLAEATR